MCPACLASAAWMIGGVLSAGGVLAGGTLTGGVLTDGWKAAAAKLLPRPAGQGTRTIPEQETNAKEK
jgi:hypothetical protein